MVTRAIVSVILLNFVACAVGMKRGVQPRETEVVGKLILGFEVPGGYGDLTVGGNPFKKPPGDLSRKLEKQTVWSICLIFFLPFQRGCF
ncbi:MAG: hypothetical protein GXO39_08545 [Thermotogae bacterium]|nr:hypothetical protein [Thermotogota bacterium]